VTDELINSLISFENLLIRLGEVSGIDSRDQSKSRLRDMSRCRFLKCRDRKS
jgi:hypothetical protein